MNRRLGGLISAVIAFAIVHLLFLLLPGFFDVWALQAHDALFQLRYRVQGRAETSAYVAHVDFDDAGLLDSGLSSADRYLQADVINGMTDAFVESVAMDIIYPRFNMTDEDYALIDAVDWNGTVHVPFVVRPRHDSSPAEEISATPLPADLVWDVAVTGGSPIEVDLVFATFDELLGVAAGAGHILVEPDADGVYRRVPLIVVHGDQVIPSLSLATVCTYLRVEPHQIDVEFGRRIMLEGAQFPDGRTRDIAIPIDRSGRMLVNFVGPWTDSFPHYAVGTIAEILADGRIDDLADELEYSIVVVSDITTGGRDLGSTPLESLYPLSGLHATTINSILTGSFVRRMPYWIDVLVGLVLVAAIWVAATRLRAILFAVAIISAFLVLLAYTVGLFLGPTLLVAAAVNGLGLALSSAVLTTRRYIGEERSRAALHAKLEHYFPPTVLRQIEAHPVVLETCQTKTLSILFSDIVAFSSWSSTRSPETIRSTLNNYFEEMVGIAFEHDGTIDKFLGDGLMVFFGDPMDQPDHASRAIRAAIKMQEATRQLRAQWEPEGGMAIEIRIGIHTGDVVVGNMGSSLRFEYTVIGADVNLANRLESAAPVGGILVSASTRELADDTIHFEDAGTISAKGFPDPILVYEVKI